MDIMQAIKTSTQIMEFRDFFLQLLGQERWNETVEEYRESLVSLKAKMGASSFIATIIPTAKRMSEDYVDPGKLIAIAVELDLREKAKGEDHE